MLSTVLLVQAVLSFTTIARGTVSEIDAPRQVVVRSAEEWAALWKEHGAQEPAPAPDFSTMMVVGVFLGSRPTAGHLVMVTAVALDADRRRVVVQYVERRPAPSDLVAQMLTSPFHLVSIPRDPARVEFRKVTP